MNMIAKDSAACARGVECPSSGLFRAALGWLNENAEKPVIVVCMLISILLITWQVIFRYIIVDVLGMTGSTAWAEETAIFCFIWATYFAVSQSVRRRETIRITVLVDRLPLRWQSILWTLDSLVFLGFSLLVLRLSWNVISTQIAFGQKTTALGIPYAIPYSVLVVAFLLISMRLAQDLVRQYRETGARDFLIGLAIAALMTIPVLLFAETDIVWILIGTLLLCMLLGVPIAISLGVAGAIGIIMSGSVPLDIVAQISLTSLDSFPILAVFFFIAAGVFMGEGGLSKQLLELGDELVGGTWGGIALASVIASMLFGAISGSATATVAAIGMITIPAMVERGYDKAFAAALMACAGIIGTLIPPSNTFVLYGVVTKASISKLFLGGVIPGLLFGTGFMAITWWISRRNGWRGTSSGFSASRLARASWEAKWAIMVPVIILGGIYGGFMTPTEAAAVAATYGLLVGVFVYKGITRHNIVKILVNCGITSAVVILLISMASIFGYIMAIERVPDAIASTLLSITSDKYAMLLLLNIFLLLVGALIETGAAIIILAPILVPVVVKLGVDPLHFGIIMAVNLGIGFVTPPVGANLFVSSAISGMPVESIAKKLIPFLVCMVAILIAVTYLPELSLWMTRLIG